MKKFHFGSNTAVKKISFIEPYIPKVNEESLVKLSEVMKWNKSVESLTVYFWGNPQRERLFATMATSGGWSSLQELLLDNTTSLSLMDAEHLSSFIIQSEKLRALTLQGAAGDQTVPIIETLARTKVQSLTMLFRNPSTLQNGGRRIVTALERCTWITDLRLDFSFYNAQVDFPILLVGSIPKMVGLKKFELKMNYRFVPAMFDMLGQCIGGHEGEIEELRLISEHTFENSSWIVGLAPALRRLKVFRFHSRLGKLTSEQICGLSDVVGDWDALEEFDYCNFSVMSTKEFKAICQLLSKFPSLKRVTQGDIDTGGVVLDLTRKRRFEPFLEMIKTSKTIEKVPSVRCRNAEKEAAIKQQCHINMMPNRLNLIRKNGLLAATVPSCAWPLILKEFSDMSDVLYYLLQQKHGAMIGPTCHGCKRKQNFD